MLNNHMVEQYLGLIILIIILEVCLLPLATRVMVFPDKTNKIP